ncbi:Cobalt-precorrin-3B C(17)-methyltransferase [Clostridiales bacterium CHKCI001]|nr:Cobalt-precorrin-3B C(17)-methyltransferase [Clostridiales bacterium CHKCI001]
MLFIVGFGAGGETGMTLEARQAIEQSDVIAGYTVYVELLKPMFPNKEYFITPMRKEKERCIWAIEMAKQNKTVALVCSGDSGVYGMASLVLELAKGEDLEIKIIPGVTAACSGAAVLGAPLSHDFAVISLSDLLTPWELIEKRLMYAAMGDFVICIYNPSSKKRADYLKKACKIVLQYQSPDTICGYVKNIGREGEEKNILSLEQLQEAQLDMFTTVYIGNSQTVMIDGRMVTPRGYLL